MNYIELINDFWQLHAEEQFSPVEGMMYFHLLDVSNRLGWKNPFKQSNQRIASVLGVTEKTIQTARKHLEEALLIQYKHGDGRKYVSTYTLLRITESDQENTSEKVEKNNPLFNVKGAGKVEKKDPLIDKEIDKNEKKGSQKVEKKDGFTTDNIKQNKTSFKKDISISPDEKKSGEDVTEAQVISILSFDEFWTMYDKKVGDKTKLEKKWNAISEQDRQKIREHVPQYKLAQPDKQYRKNPETYLNNKSWNDEIIAKGKTGAAAPGSKEATTWDELAVTIQNAFGK